MAETEETRGFLEERVIPILSESTLWPVFIVIIAHVAAFGGYALALAWTERRLSAMAAVLGLLWLAGTVVAVEIRQRRKVGLVSFVVGLTLSLAVAFTVAGFHWGLF